MAPVAEKARGQDGGTVIESLVAALVLAVGLLTAYMMLAVAEHSSADVRARETAVALARQISEDARSIDYSQLSNATIATTLQGFPGLSSSSSGSTWTIVRNGVTYAVTAAVANLNDPKDSTGATDIKQVTTAVSWTTFQKQTHTVSETVTVTVAGQDPGLSASALQLASWPLVGVSGTQTSPVVTSTSVGSLQFSVTAPATATAIVWTLNGSKQSSWNGSAPSGTTWTSNVWSLSGLSDGTYTIGAQAEDSSGVDGPGVTMAVRLIRNVPSAPTVTGDGFNTNFMVSGSATNVAEFQWNSNPELNVVGYNLYNPSGALICQTFYSTSFPASCGNSAWCSSATACVDMSPPAFNSSLLTYTLEPLYYDVNNTLQTGTATSVTLTGGAPTPPAAPSSITVTAQPDGTAYVTWTPVSGGTQVSFYRIYRNGDNYGNRYDVLPASSCSATCSYHDTGRSTAQSYYVSSVGGAALGSDMAESAATGPQTG